ncbi:MAG: carboxypeptidase-like regulatory domain-containing protein [Bacteroidales bacterium]|nr:carboxypeptidase-like regulatory domain-containing protein [Bacteroidales bacterium]
MKKAVLILTVIFALGINGFAIDDDKKSVQTTTVKGKVVDQISGEALTGVQVKIEGTNLTAYTDFDGNFVIENVAPGNYNIQTTYISYQTNVLKEVNLNSVSNNCLKVEMKSVTSN